MRRIVAYLGVVLLGVFGAPVAGVQEGEEVLTNAEVVALTEAGLPAALIVAKIAATRTDFDTSVEQLVSLSAAGVDAGVIEAMVAATSPSSVASVTADAPGRPPPRQAGAADARAPGTVFRDCDGCPEMVVIPAGLFRMGCVSGRECDDNEKPVEPVTIWRPFALSKYEVTFEEYDRFLFPLREDDKSWGRGRRPAINVSWDYAQLYVEWLSANTGARYRLPSEAEWEYAARAGTTTAYSWGNEIGNNRANCNGCGSQWDDRMTAPVGSFGANAWGLHDMHGNVWEWTEDCWHGSYDGAPEDGSAWTTGQGWRWVELSCSERVQRGGSWNNRPRFLRAAARWRTLPRFKDGEYGVRVARTLD